MNYCNQQRWIVQLVYLAILRGRLFSLSSNDAAILMSYNRFSVRFNLKHYQISKDLSYLHLYKRLLSIFREVVILEELLFCKMDHK